MICYLCQKNNIQRAKGKVRDSKTLRIMKCEDCGLVFLDSFDHINDNFYAESKMRTHSQSIEEWILETTPDDERRAKFFLDLCENKDVLDFGSGNGNFLKLIKPVAASTTAVELDTQTHKIYKRLGISYASSLDELRADTHYDIITAFHVIEHLKDPIKFLNNLAPYLKADGKIFLEFPNSKDALLSLYQSSAFSDFTYWSCHLMLFDEDNIKQIVEKAGLMCYNVWQIQRYPLSNHLFWLSKQQPAGHEKWSFLNSETLEREYARILGSQGMCDTIMVEVRKC